MRALPITAALLLTLTASAQIPNTLLHSIPAPPVGVQTGGQLGYSVVVEGEFTVVGVPYDDIGGGSSGVVKVFDSSTGALRLLIPNPGPAVGDLFGFSVAISGTHLVVGTPADDTGALDTGAAYVYDLASSTPAVPVVTLNNPEPGDLDSFGYSVTVSGTRVVVGAYKNDTIVPEAGSVYLYELSSGTPTLPMTTLNNPGPAQQDYFGYSVAISGTRLIVGCPTDDFGALNAGVAYVYDLSVNTTAMRLANPSPAMGNVFGWSVAISGTQAVVGARQNDTGASNAGSAYVYDLSSDTPTAPAHALNNPTPEVGDNFGTAVGISGTWVVVGAQGDNTGADDAGSAYAYDLGSATPTVPVHTLNNQGPAVNDQFGWSAAISGTQVVVGARFDDTGADDAGSAYTYNLESGTPAVPVHTLNHPGPTVEDEFGYSVSVSGMLMVVGARLEDTGAGNAGSAYVYDLSSGTPSVPVHTLNNPSPAFEDLFGVSVAICGTWVVVGAPHDDTGAINAGSVYVYELDSGTPTVPLHTLNNPSSEPGGDFGRSVSISGTWVVVGTPYDDMGGSDAGRAYVYDLSSGTPTVPMHSLNNPSPGGGGNFGSSVAISGTRVVVGFPNDRTGPQADGSVHVYDLSSGTPTVPVHTLYNPSPVMDNNFGESVAISGTRVVVAADLDSTVAEDAGSAFVYDLSSGTPTLPLYALNNPSPAENDHFGSSVAISGTRIVVAANRDDTGEEDVGSAYVYDLSSSTPTEPVATLNNPSPAVSDYFGTSVAVDGTTVAIGARLDDTVTYDKGSAYVFGPHPLDLDSDGLLDTWERTYWHTTTGHGPLDDEDKDGIVNLLELAFGLNPTQGNGSPLPPAVNEGGYLTLTLTKQFGVTYEVQSAGTLLPALPESFSAASTTVLLDNATTLKVRDNVLMSTPGGRFMRAKVTAAP